MTETKQITAPERIWLSETDYRGQIKQVKDDAEYVRADLFNSLLAENAAFRAALSEVEE